LIEKKVFAQSVQSIIGATEIRRSTIPAFLLCETTISAGFSALRVSAGFWGISGSLAVAEVT
jgi:hypothetical protein